jgi:dethiobiotin synthetase
MHIDRIIVAGTDTGIGKTVLSALVTLALDGEYWKPVQSGLEEESDTECVARFTGLPRERFHPEAYRLTRPLSPDQSAGLDGITIERERLIPPSCTRPLVIEPAGGLMVPYSDDLLQIDCFAWWQAPVLLAARSGLGTLNHTLLSIEALRRRAIPVAGIVMIGPEHAMNRASLARWTNVPVIGTVPQAEKIEREWLRAVYNERFLPIDQWSIAHE